MSAQEYRATEDGYIFAGEYTNEGEPDAMIQVTSFNGELAQRIATLLNALAGVPDPEALVRAARAALAWCEQTEDGDEGKRMIADALRAALGGE